jgi:16S rRNA processing protein RimM
VPGGTPRRLEVGRVGRPHGLHGEIAVTFVSDRVERTTPGAVLFAPAADGTAQTLVIETARPHQGRWLLCFAGVDDRTAAEALRGTILSADELPSTDVGELWVHQLVGATVYDTAGGEIGEVVAVQANPAHDLLVLDGGALVPVTFVVEHGPERVVVDLPDGLLEL